MFLCIFFCSSRHSANNAPKLTSSWPIHVQACFWFMFVAHSRLDQQNFIKKQAAKTCESMALPCHKLCLWSIHWPSMGFLWTHPCSLRFVLWQFPSNLFASCSFEGMIGSDPFQVPKFFKLKNSRSSRSSGSIVEGVESVDNRGGLHKAQAEQLKMLTLLRCPSLLKAETLQSNSRSPTPFKLLAKGWALCPMCWCCTKHCSARMLLHGTAAI